MLVGACLSLLALTLLVNLIISRAKGQRRLVYYVELLEPEPIAQYSAFLTWSDYCGLDPVNAGWLSEIDGNRHWSDSPARIECEKAVYLWNGNVMGRGKEGFDKAIKMMKALPAGSSIKIYPNYEALPEEPTTAGIDRRLFPFHYYERALVEAARQRKLLLVFSPRDDSGRFAAEVVTACKALNLILPDD